MHLLQALQSNVDVGRHEQNDHGDQTRLTDGAFFLATILHRLVDHSNFFEVQAKSVDISAEFNYLFYIQIV